MVWLLDEKPLALFPAGTIVRDPHLCEYPTCCEQGLLHIDNNKKDILIIGILIIAAKEYSINSTENRRNFVSACIIMG